MESLPLDQFKALTLDTDLVYLDKCVICNQPASKSCGSCELEFYCCKEHQRQDWKRHKSNCSNNDVRKHDEFGFCMVAKKLIQAGDLIVSEYPIAIYSEEIDTEGKNLQKLFCISKVFPYSCPSCDLGKLCPQQIHRCSKCGIPLCKKACEELPTHRDNECSILQAQGVVEGRDISCLKDILVDVMLLRVLLKEDRKGSPISFDNRKWKPVLKKAFREKLHGESVDKHPISTDIIKSFKAVDNLPLSLRYADSRELIILLHCALTSYGISLHNDNRRRFLYTKNQYLTHSCSPNAEMWIDCQEQYTKLIIKATRSISVGQRITVNKAGNLISIPTLERRKKLKQLFGINCNCRRCRDPTELGTYVSAVRCEESGSPKGCSGHYLSRDPMSDTAVWRCSDSSCKSFKSWTEIQQICRNAEKDLPPVSGQADIAIQKLKSFIDYFTGDVLSPNHLLIRIARTRMRQVAKYFLGTGEKLFLCVVNDYPRAYEYCSIILKSVESMQFLVDKVNPSFNETRGKLLYEKGVLEFALAMYDSRISRVQSIRLLVLKVQEALRDFKDAATSISIYSHTLTLQHNIKFFESVIKKIFRGFCSSKDLMRISHLSFERLESDLNRFEENWKIQSKEIGLIKFYMEPFGGEIQPSLETLRTIILSY